MGADQRSGKVCRDDVAPVCRFSWSARRRGARGADGVATRAIEIRAPTSAVWPWIAQIGPSPRGGAYTHDWIEDLLGLNMHSADTVLPELQHPEVGETIGLGANRLRLK